MDSFNFHFLQRLENTFSIEMMTYQCNVFNGGTGAITVLFTPGIWLQWG